MNKRDRENPKVNIMKWLFILAFLLFACQPVATPVPIILTEQTPTVTTIISTPTSTPTMAVTATTTLIPSATPLSSPVTPYPEEWLAFVERDFRGRTSHPNISVLDVADTSIAFIRPDGKGLLEPKMFEEFDSMVEHSLVWSPDGKYMLFDWSNFVLTMTRIPVYHLVDMPRQKITLLAPNQAWNFPSWSPDSKWFVASLLTTVTNQEGKEQDTYSLIRVNTKTFQKDRITTSTSSDLYPSWSPDGKWIAFLRYTPESMTPKPGSGTECGRIPASYSGCIYADLYIVRSDGGDPTLLLESVYMQIDQYGRDSVYNAPSWSPDGKWLAVLIGNEQPDIALVNIENGETRVLAPHLGLDTYPTWSPDGSKLAFVSDRDGNEEIYLMSRNGNDLVNLTNNAGSDFNPVWSPSGRYLAFLSDREESRAYKLYVMSLDGRDQQKIYDGYVFTKPAWFPLIGVDLGTLFSP